MAARLDAARRLLPGMLTALVIALAATFISEHYGGPQFLYALFFGMAFHFLATDPKTRPGIDFTARAVLRFGVALLGARVTLEQIATLGAGPIALVAAAVVATIAFGACAGRLLGRPLAEGVLTGGAVAICGASAALAISAVLPRSERSSQFTLLTVVGVTALSTLAMIVYPALVPVFGFDSGAAGVFLGGTIHDVAQVVGAGYIVSQQAGDSATFVKLFRVALLVPVVLALALLWRGRGAASGVRAAPLPWFLVAFLVLLTVNTAGGMPENVNAWLAALSRWCLVAAIAALGVKTSFQDLAALGWRPIAMLVSETLFLAVVIVGGLLLLRA
jgi:uncharacterized integral membrane protein (TIGR00698 family)